MTPPQIPWHAICAGEGLPSGTPPPPQRVSDDDFE